MTVSGAQAFYGLRATVTPTSTNTDGTLTVGVPQTAIAFADANVVYSVGAFICDSGSSFVIDLSDGSTASSDAYVPGVAQVETATVVAAGGITTAGDAEVIVTASGLAGSPKTYSVALALNDTAAQAAGKIRTALAADTALTALHTVGGTSANITLTQLPSSTATVGATSIPLYDGNDATLNISIDNDTCAGITQDLTSTDTTAGVQTTGVYLFDGGGLDFEGITIPTIATLNGFILQNSSDSVGGAGVTSTDTNITNLGVGETALRIGSAGLSLDTLTFVPSSSAYVTITVIGQTA